MPLATPREDSIGVDCRTVTIAFVPERVIGGITSEVRTRATCKGASADRDVSQSAEWLAAWSTERALVCALIAGRLLDSYTWDGLLDVAEAMAANAWDCYPSQGFGLAART